MVHMMDASQVIPQLAKMIRFERQRLKRQTKETLNVKRKLREMILAEKLYKALIRRQRQDMQYLEKQYIQLEEQHDELKTYFRFNMQQMHAHKEFLRDEIERLNEKNSSLEKTKNGFSQIIDVAGDHIDQCNDLINDLRKLSENSTLEDTHEKIKELLDNFKPIRL